MTGSILRATRWRLRPDVKPSTAAAAMGALGLTVLISTKAAEISPLASLAAALFLVLPVWLFFNRRVEISLVVLVVYLGLIDGILKLGTDIEAAALGRDVVLYAIAAGMLARSVLAGGDVRLPPLTGFVLAWLLVVLVQLLNPGNGEVTQSLAALRQHIEFVPLFFIGFAVMTSIRRLRGFFMLLLVVAAANGCVAVVQSGLSPQQLAGWGPGYANLIEGDEASPRAFAGRDGEAHVRPPGLGSDAGFAGVLAAIALPGGLALLLTRRRSPHGAFFACAVILAAMLALLAVVTSQSRAAVVVAIVSVLAFVALATTNRQVGRTFGALVLVGMLLFAAVALAANQSRGGGFRYESIAPDRVLRTTIESRSGTIAAIPGYLVAFPFGSGIGSVGPAAGVIGGAAKPLNAESQYTFLIVELGAVGLLVFLVFEATLLVGLVRRLRPLRGTETHLLLAGLSAPLFGQVVNWTVGATTATSPSAPYLWFAAGVLSFWLWAGGPSAHGLPPDEGRRVSSY